MAYRLEDLTRDVRTALSLPPGEAVRRLSHRAARYTRRFRIRRRSGILSDGDLLSALAEPAGSVADLVARRRRSVPLVPASTRASEIGEILRESAPRSLEPILGSARAVASGVFDLLGSGSVPLGPEIDWQKDFKSGKRWDPDAYSSEIAVVPDQRSDIKVPWELARLQHLATLGIASAVTGDSRFRDDAVAQVRSFLLRNPLYRGVNWACTMDVAIRAVALLSAEGLLRESGEESFWIDLLKSLLLHARFVRDNLVDGPIRGNHFLSHLSGLYLCALGLPEFRESSDWRSLARDALSIELGRQVGGDGFDFEASTSYHAFVTEMYLFPALLGSEKGDPFPRNYHERLEKMLEAVSVLMRRNGTLPQIGDNDDGRFLIFSQYHRTRRDWRPLMALGAYLFRREEWLPLAGEAWVEGAWLIGERFLEWRKGIASAKDPPDFPSRPYPEAGVYQLATDSIQMVVEAGGVGQGGNGGHAHNDTLSFDLQAWGEEILPDRGTGTYTPDLAIRNRFRSTRAHNTVQVDGEEINPIPPEPFRLVPADHPRTRRWRTGKRWVYLSAEHFGYRRLSFPVVHRRRILLDRLRCVYRLQDQFDGRGRHQFEWSFHLSPGWGAELETGGWTARRGPDAPQLRFEWVNRPEGIRCRIEEDLHSPSYGVFQSAKAIRIEWEAQVPCAVSYRLKLVRAEQR